MPYVDLAFRWIPAGVKQSEHLEPLERGYML
jgi:hypothetical protein